MNIKNIFSALLGFSLMFSACTSEEVDVVSPSTNTPGVYLRLSGAATAKATSRATVAAEDGEKTVNNLLVVLFDTHDGFYKTVPAICIDEDTNEYTFIVEKDATYDIWLVANASDKLKADLGNIPAGTPFENSETGENCLNSIIADQAPDADGNFLMVSKYSEKVTTRITESQSIGEVHMIRVAARFDLLNKAENVTVTSVAFANRTVKSAVLTPNTASTIADWYESKDYEVNVAGEPENGKEWNGHIYTYENYSTEDNKPVLTISYYEGENSADIKTHVVKLIDPNSTAGTSMPIKRNNLYRIVLTKATKLDFNLQVLDWDDEEASIEHTEVPLILPKDVQDSLNRQLLVYDLFADNIVNTLIFAADGQPATATLFDEFLPANEYPIGSFFSWNDLNSKGLCGNEESSYIYVDGQPYQLPTVGQLQLLTVLPEMTQDNASAFEQFPSFNPLNNIETESFDEFVYLKNNDTGNQLITEDFSDESIAFKGETQLLRGIHSQIISNKTITINETPLVIYCQQEDEGANSFTRYPCYGIRFKGSNQCAAYRWEAVVTDDGKSYYVSVKIKALPDKGKGYEVYDIVDNNSFWKEDTYIEVKIPYTGYYSASAITPTYLNSSYMIQRTKKLNPVQTGTDIYCWSSGSGTCRLGLTTRKPKNPLRLVKVKQQTEENK